MADSIPVILSKARPDQPDRARLDGQLAEALSGRPGIELHVLPHVYDLAPDGPGVEFIRSIRGPMIVLAWLYPRSTFWVLDAHGVQGRLGQAASLPEGEPGAPPGDQVMCVSDETTAAWANPSLYTVWGNPLSRP